MGLRMLLSPRRVLLVLLAVGLGLLAVSVAASYVYYVKGRSYDDLPLRFFLDEDMSVPTWFAAAQLACASLLLLAFGVRDRPTDATKARGWWMLAAVFAAASVDEVATVHEWTGSLFGEDHRGWLYYPWVIGGAAVAVTIAVLSIPLLVRLPTRTRTLFVLAGSVFIGGALLVEASNGRLADLGSSDMRYSLQSALEEMMELLGVTLFVYALVDHARATGLRIAVSFGPEETAVRGGAEAVS
jgi:hypothetical protein